MSKADGTAANIELRLEANTLIEHDPEQPDWPNVITQLLDLTDDLTQEIIDLTHQPTNPPTTNPHLSHPDPIARPARNLAT